MITYDVFITIGLTKIIKTYEINLVLSKNNNYNVLIIKKYKEYKVRSPVCIKQIVKNVTNVMLNKQK